jgi:hypothetical protein
LGSTCAFQAELDLLTCFVIRFRSIFYELGFLSSTFQLALPETIIMQTKQEGKAIKIREGHVSMHLAGWKGKYGNSLDKPRRIVLSF